PDHIPELTYEQFVDFHGRYYHPSNSRIYLYGDVNVEDRLAHLAEYLDAFEPLAIESRIEPQPRFEAPVHREGSYLVSPDESTERKPYAVRAWLLEQAADPEYLLAMTVLDQMLCGTEATPLRQALTEARLGEDCLSYGLESDILETYFSI